MKIVVTSVLVDDQAKAHVMRNSGLLGYRIR